MRVWEGQHGLGVCDPLPATAAPSLLLLPPPCDCRPLPATAAPTLLLLPPPCYCRPHPATAAPSPRLLLLLKFVLLPPLLLL